MELNTYIVEGGVGKCTAFTALIDKLAKKANSGIQVYTPYISCFANNPNVKLAFEQTLPLSDKRIMASSNIYYSEPYKSNFQFGNQHLIEAYSNLHDVKFDTSMVPKMFTEQLKPIVDKWKEEKKVNKDYILVQFTGGQSAWTGGAPNTQYINGNPGRIYPQYLAQSVINLIREKYPKLTIIDCTLPNEPSYEGTIKCDLHWSALHELLKDAKTYIAIDSCLQHFSPSVKKRGTVIWGSTKWIQYGYTHNTNLHYHMGKKWNDSKFDANDPRNVLVSPETVFDSFENLYNFPKEKEIACAKE